MPRGAQWRKNAENVQDKRSFCLSMVAETEKPFNSLLVILQKRQIQAFTSKINNRNMI
jgi:hypothetical protein